MGAKSHLERYEGEKNWHYLHPKLDENDDCVTIAECAAGTMKYFRIIRAPRPLILVRVFRNFLKFQLPKSRLNSIFK